MPRYGDEKKRTYLKCRPRRIIPHCLDVCNEFAYVFECGHSRFSAVLLAASQFIYAPGINVSYAVSPPPPSQKITFARPTFNVPSLDSLVQTSLSLFLSFSYIYSSIIVNNHGLFKVRCRKSGFVIRSSRFKCVPFKKESC